MLQVALTHSDRRSLLNRGNRIPGFVSGKKLIGYSIPHGIEPAPTSVRMYPALIMHAFRVVSEKYVVPPLFITQPVWILRAGNMRLPVTAELQLVAPSAPWAIYQQHVFITLLIGKPEAARCQRIQCATAAAAPSSTSAPVLKRSIENGAAIGCMS